MKDLKTGILLVNLGTPTSPDYLDVINYLIEFLTDPRVIDIPAIKRHLLVKGAIVPNRYKESSRCYKEIWTEEGSPLMVYSKRVKELLQNKLGDEFTVELAMRYQNPSIEHALNTLQKQPLKELLIFPLFPQYASATTGSIQQKVMEVIARWTIIPKINFIQSFANHPAFIKAFCATASKHDLKDYDHILFSFHGLPKRQLIKADVHNCCMQSETCCTTLSSKNKDCYSAQCYATAEGIAKGLKLKPDQYSLCFQSRLGKEPWIEPYTSDVIEDLAKEGKKKILVFCPSFVCDCVETLYEISEEYGDEFKSFGGEILDLVPGLNEHPEWIRALKKISLENLSKPPTKQKAKRETQKLTKV